MSVLHLDVHTLSLLFFFTLFARHFFVLLSQTRSLGTTRKKALPSSISPKTLTNDPIVFGKPRRKKINKSFLSVFFLYQFIRRPTHILDHALTLTFSHLLLTTYYAASFPTSFFWWLIVGSCTLGTIVMAEQLCVKREMMEDLGGDWSGNVEERGSGDHDRSNTDGLLAASRAGGEETIELLGVGRRGSKGGDEGPDDVGSAREPEGSSGSGWEGKDTGGGDGGPALMATSSSSRTTVTSGGKDGPSSRPRD